MWGLAADPDRDHRQVHGVDGSGDTFAHTGTECVPWCGHRPGDGFSVAGNMLTGTEMLAAMADSEPRPYHNLRVDDHAEPVAELRRLFELAAGFIANLLEQYGDDGLRRYRQVKL